MNFSIADIITGLITAIITWVSGHFFTLFRQRQLYLVFHKPMRFPYDDDQNYKVSVIVINKGKDKESNVKISFPNTQGIALIASDHEAITIEKHIVKIDRVLAGEEINLVLLINSKYAYEQSFLPSITSDDVNGKSYRTLTGVPPSGRAFVSGGMVVVFVICFLFLLPTIFDKGQELYGWYKYGDFADKGFTLDKYTTKDSVDGFSFKNNDMPIDLVSFSYEGGYAVYEFYVKNNKLENLKGSISFEPRNRDAYYAELSGINEKYSNTNKEMYFKLIDDLHGRYFIDDVDESFNIQPMQSKKITIKRKIIDGMGFDDMKIKIELKLERLKSYESTTIKFNSQNNIAVNSILKNVFK